MLKRLIIFFGLLLVVLVLLITFADNYLIINKPVVTKNLIIEGWLPQYTIERDLDPIGINNYSRIYITGIAGKFDTTFINKEKANNKNLIKIGSTMLTTNATVYLTDFAIKKLNKKKVFNKITIYSFGDTAFRMNAHYFVSLSDSVIGGTFSKTYSNPFKINGKFYKKDLKLFNIFYDNDLSLSKNDRNLIIDSISFDNIVLNNEADFFSIPENTLPNGIRNYPFHSNAIYTKAYMKALGFKGELITIDTLYTDRNKTWAAAKQFAKFHKSGFSNEESINILSFNYHSRRSFLTYKHVLPNAKIGIISLKNINDPKTNGYESKTERILNILDEYVSIVGNLFFN